MNSAAARKLSLAGLIALLCVFAAALGRLVYVQHQVDKSQALLSELQECVDAAYLSHQQFVNRYVKSEEFYKTGTIPEFDNCMKQLNLALAVVDKLNSDNRVFLGNDLATALRSYMKDIDQYRLKSLEIGYKDFGLQGAWREEAHKVEKLIAGNSSLMIHYLQARRHEKDFIARGEPQYFDEMLDSMESLEKGLRKSGPQAAIVSLDTYREKVKRYRDASAELQKIQASLEKDAETFLRVFRMGKIRIIDDELAYQSRVRMIFIIIAATLGLLALLLGRSLRTARREVVLQERELREQQIKLDTATGLAMLGELATDIAHEITNPLSVLDAQIRRLQKAAEHREIKAEEVNELTNLIGRIADRIRQTVISIGSIVRRGDQDPFESAEARRLIDITMPLIQARLNKHHVNANIEADGGLRCDCRETQISQVLLNLFNNAVDAVKPLQEKWIRVGIVEAGDMVEFRMTDSGKGIEPNFRERIFDAFYSTKQDGLGLGLSVSRAIAQAHGGYLKIDTGCPNTCFVLGIPKKHVVHLATAEV